MEEDAAFGSHDLLPGKHSGQVSGERGDGRFALLQKDLMILLYPQNADANGNSSLAPCVFISDWQSDR